MNQITKSFIETVAEKLIEQLKEGTAPWQKPWQAGEPGAFLPVNPTTGKRYKGINAIHLMSQGHSDQRWMTYKQAAAAGAQVRKGEKGTPIQYWKFNEEHAKTDADDKPVLDDRGDPIKQTIRLERPALFFATVFNAEQIDGLPLVQGPRQPVWGAVDRIEKILQASGAEIEHGERDRAFYRPVSDSIHLPARGQFDTAEAYYATALHELGHWTGHRSRLDRDLAHPFGSEGYAREELRAEIASMILGDELGIGHDPKQHVAYVGSWIKKLQDDPLEIFRAAADAEKIQSYVLGLQQNRKLENEADDGDLVHGANAARPGQAKMISQERLNLDSIQVRSDDKSLSTFNALDEAARHYVNRSIDLNRVMTDADGRILCQGVWSPDGDYEGDRFASKEVEAAVRAAQKEYWAALSQAGNSVPPVEFSGESATSAQVAADAKAVADFIAVNQNLLASKVAENTRAAAPELKAILSDESRMGAADDLVGTLLEHINRTYVHEVQAVIATTLGRPDAQERVDIARTSRDLLKAETGVASDAPVDINQGAVVAGRQASNQETNMQTIEASQSRGAVTMAQHLSSLAAALDLTDGEAEVAAARLDLMHGDVSFRHGAAEALDSAAQQHLGFTLPHDWNGRVKVQGNVTEEVDGEQQVTAAVLLGLDPEFWSVYAQHEDGKHQWLADVASSQEARKLADRLALIDAHSESNEYEKAMKLARIREEMVQRDPASTPEDLAAAREVRKDVEFAATTNSADLQRRIAEFERERQAVAANAPSNGDGAKHLTEKTFISVPFKEKDEAKALGAKWDRREQSWYVPGGSDLSPFEEWVKVAAAGRPGPADSSATGAKTAEGRAVAKEHQFLAVPYGERKLAKAAGALWDKVAKSWYAGAKANMAKLARWKPDNSLAQQGPAMTPREEFGEALRSLGCVLSGEHPIMDGQKHRITVEGEKHSERSGSGFYVGHLDGHPAGHIKNNKTGQAMDWKSKGYSLDPEQKAQLQAEAAAKLQARAAEQAMQQEAAARRVSRQMADLVPVTQPTPYMQAKGIEPQPGAFTDKEGKTTYIPATDVRGKQWTMQYILEDGTKRFAKDSRKTGCFHVVGGIDALAKAPALVIGEGYATASSLSQSLGFATVAAFDSGNLPVVAKALHERFPDKPVFIAGDNDQHVEATLGVNPGKSKAQEAAKATGGMVLLPIFAPGEQAANPKGFTDFNDLATKSVLGHDGVSRQVVSAVNSAVEKHHVDVQQPERALLHERPRRQSAKIG